jgi:hypothetical protein
VVEGNMNAVQVKLELERLVPAKVSWVVEEIEKNMFKTIFPSKGEMLRMIEWGELQTKDRKAKLVIEELRGGSSIKQVMKKVWVQMTKLPSELRDYLTIWAIGTILGVTKDVDMIFTRQYNRPRMQVLMLDPTLIPTLVDVVIGDNVYELHFRVEPEGMQDVPKPLDMEDDSDEYDKKMRRGQEAMIRVTSCRRIETKGHMIKMQAASLELILLGHMMAFRARRMCNTLPLM